ncbi:MAG: hypothetical protein C5B50_19090, partial [Verrucomicrobia bacterium]
GCASTRRFASQQAIFQEGGEADHFYLIIDGDVALGALAPDKKLIPIQRLGAGEMLGWSCLFPPYRWHFTALTRKPTEVISLDARAMREKAAEDRQFNNELLCRVAQTLYLRLLGALDQLIRDHPEACRLNRRLPRFRSLDEDINGGESISYSI